MREPVRAGATQGGGAEPARCAPGGASPAQGSVAQTLRAPGGAVSLAGAPIVTPATPIVTPATPGQSRHSRGVMLLK